jgi:thiol-disulfide isomerase/thioredoxin
MKLPPVARSLRAARYSSVFARLALALAIWALTGCAASLPHPLVGHTMPEPAAEVVAGDGPHTLAEARGKVVIVEFWATYCRPCAESFPKYQALADRYRGELVVLAVSVDDRGSVKAARLRQFAREAGVHFPIVWATDDVAQTYALPGIPFAAVIDRRGVVRYTAAGGDASLDAFIARRVEQLVREPR